MFMFDMANLGPEVLSDFDTILDDLASTLFGCFDEKVKAHAEKNSATKSMKKSCENTCPNTNCDCTANTEPNKSADFDGDCNPFATCDCCDECDCEDDYEDSFIYFPDTITDAVKKVIFRNPYTIVFWNDDTITKVKCSNGDSYDPEKGLAMAVLKKLFGNRYFRDMTKIIANSECDTTPFDRKAVKAAKKVKATGIAKNSSNINKTATPDTNKAAEPTRAPSLNNFIDELMDDRNVTFTNDNKDTTPSANMVVETVKKRTKSTSKKKTK